MTSRNRISLVATVLNEYGSIPGWLEGLQCQTRPPDECIIVDGGSTDGTWSMLVGTRLPFPTRLLRYPGAKIAQGRNLAIEQSGGDIIVVTDAGTRAEPAWIERLVEPLDQCPNLDLVAGFFAARNDGFWARTLAATTLPDVGEIDPKAFLPSSRSFAIRKRWFEHGIRYPEWLDYSEDVVLDLQLRRAGARQAFRGDAVVEFEPRPDPVGFARQYYRYARGDGKAGLFTRRHALRYLTYVAAIVVVVRRRPLEFLVCLLLGALYVRVPLLRYFRRHPEARKRPAMLVGAPVAIAAQRCLGDSAKMAGYVAGIVWRIRRDRALRLTGSSWARRSQDGTLRRL